MEDVYIHLGESLNCMKGSLFKVSRRDEISSTDEMTQDLEEKEVSYRIHIDRKICTECGLCEAFCPVNVFVMDKGPQAVHSELCWGCETCAGQCPENAIYIESIAPKDQDLSSLKKAAPLSSSARATYERWEKTLHDILGLKWHPVAISLIKTGDPLPDVPLPETRLRFCQSLMGARRGKSFMMPVNRHACPDGTSILGLSPMPEKLASGELYILFNKLNSVEAAKRMVHERPCLEPRSVEATVVSPLAKAQVEPDVVAVIAQPEQIMWLCMATSYYTGHRHEFHASGYNAQCVETTLLPYTTGKVNISFGCYGCRASSDVGDDLMMMGIPLALMEDIVTGLEELGKKTIPQSRNKVYLPPY